MGCGVSKLAPDQEGRLRPVLRRRFEELIARRNAGLSKKQLLEGDAIIVSRDSEVEDEDNFINNKQHHNNNETLDCDHHVFHDTQDCPPTPQIIAPPTNDNTNEVHNEETNNSVDDVNNNNNNKDDACGDDNKNNNDNVEEDECGNNKEDDENKVKEEKGLHGVEVTTEGLLHEEEEKEEEECSVDDGERLELSLGSPSFRVYCVNHSSDEELDEIAEHLESEDCIKEDDKNCPRQESSSSNEVSDEKQILKKQRRMRKFKRINMPKGGKRVLHKMPSFYNFPCSCNSHNSHLMQQKTTA